METQTDRFAEAIRRYWYITLAASVIGAVAAVVLLSGYQATSRFVYDPDNASLVASALPADIFDDAEGLTNEVAVLTSETVSDRVERELGAPVDVSVASDVDFTHLDVTVKGPDEDTVGEALELLGEVFADSRRVRLEQLSAGTVATVEARKASIADRLKNIDSQLASIPGDNSVLANALITERASLADESSSVAQQGEAISSYAANVGNYVSVVPTTDPGPAVPVVVRAAVGALGGAGLGFMIALGLVLLGEMRDSGRKAWPEPPLADDEKKSQA